MPPPLKSIFFNCRLAVSEGLGLVLQLLLLKGHVRGMTVGGGVGLVVKAFGLLIPEMNVHSATFLASHFPSKTLGIVNGGVSARQVFCNNCKLSSPGEEIC